MKSILSVILFFPLIILFYITIVVFSNPYLNSAGKQTEYFNREMRSLREEMHLGAAKEMQQLFPEGYVFTNVIYGLSAAELSRKSINLGEKEFWRNEVSWVLREIESGYAKERFEEKLHPPYGAFYHSWITWLTGNYLTLFNSKEADSILYNRFKRECREIKDSYLIDGNPYPESYKSLAWAGDALPGIAALKLSDENFGTNYQDFINDWIEAVENKLKNPGELIPHSITESSRGSSQTLILRFLYEIEPSFARQQYRLFKEKFVDDFLTFSLVKESAESIKIQDVDSGPVIFGYGSVASIIGIGTAKFLGDKELFKDLNLAIELVKVPADYFGDDLIITDLFLLWSRISQPINKQPVHLSSQIFKNTKYNYSAYTLIYFLIFIFLMRTIWRKRTCCFHCLQR